LSYSPLPDCRSRDGLGVVGTRKRRGAVCEECYVQIAARQGEVDLSIHVAVDDIARVKKKFGS
jgi:hypothetical protein